MSLQKQIKRNIAKETKQTLGKYERAFKPDYNTIPMSDLSLFANMAKNGITVNDLDREIRRARVQAFQDTAPAVMKWLYASFCLTLVEHFGFSKEDCFKVLSETDKRVSVMIDTDDLVKEMEEKVGIRFNSFEGVERVEML